MSDEGEAAENSQPPSASTARAYQNTTTAAISAVKPSAETVQNSHQRSMDPSIVPSTSKPTFKLKFKLGGASTPSTVVAASTVVAPSVPVLPVQVPTPAPVFSLPPVSLDPVVTDRPRVIARKGIKPIDGDAPPKQRRKRGPNKNPRVKGLSAQGSAAGDSPGPSGTSKAAAVGADPKLATAYIAPIKIHPKTPVPRKWTRKLQVLNRITGVPHQLATWQGASFSPYAVHLNDFLIQNPVSTTPFPSGPTTSRSAIKITARPSPATTIASSFISPLASTSTVSLPPAIVPDFAITSTSEGSMSATANMDTGGASLKRKRDESSDGSQIQAVALPALP